VTGALLTIGLILATAAATYWLMQPVGSVKVIEDFKPGGVAKFAVDKKPRGAKLWEAWQPVIVAGLLVAAGWWLRGLLSG
jgi:hypothetical protein